MNYVANIGRILRLDLWCATCWRALPAANNRGRPGGHLRRTHTREHAAAGRWDAGKCPPGCDREGVSAGQQTRCCQRDAEVSTRTCKPNTGLPAPLLLFSLTREFHDRRLDRIVNTRFRVLSVRSSLRIIHPRFRRISCPCSFSCLLAIHGSR